MLDAAPAVERRSRTRRPGASPVIWWRQARTEAGSSSNSARHATAGDAAAAGVAPARASRRARALARDRRHARSRARRRRRGGWRPRRTRATRGTWLRPPDARSLPLLREQVEVAERERVQDDAVGDHGQEARHLLPARRVRQERVEGSVGSASVCTVMTKRFSTTPAQARKAAGDEQRAARAACAAGPGAAPARGRAARSRRTASRCRRGRRRRSAPGARRAAGAVRLIHTSVSTDFSQHVDDEQRARDAAEQLVDLGLRPAAGAESFETSQVVSSTKLGPTAAAERMNRKKVEGQTAKRLAEGERPAPQDAVEPAERALVEEREERADQREHDHQLVQLELEHQQRRDAPQLAVPEHDRQVLDRQHGQVAGEAERHLGQHRVDVRVPEGEPGAQRLADVDREDRDGAASSR